MKTLGLLAVGSSFAGMRGRPATLKLDRRSLPRFGKSKESPFRVPGRSEDHKGKPEISEAQQSSSARDLENLPSPSEAETLSAARRFNLRGARAGRGRSNARPRRRRGASNWLRWARSLFGQGHPEEPRMVQGELSLDAVQVVRNDLEDMDVEVVTPARAVVGRLRRKEAQLEHPVVAVSRWRCWMGAWTRMSK